MDFLSTKSRYLALVGTFMGSDDRGFIFEDAGNRHAESLGDELKRRFDIVVDMNQHRTAEKGKSIVTFGLCGCIGGYIDNPETNTIFHYDPFGVPVIETLARNHVSEKTAKVHFFVPGEWAKDTSGKYQMQPKQEYTGGMLSSTIAYVESKGIECVFHCYSEHSRGGNDYMARNQGTAWIDSQGKLFAEGLPVANNSPQEPTPSP